MASLDYERQLAEAERQRKKEKRKNKWEERSKKFWKSFLFTEDGKPKSGFFIYTFCLSFLMLAIYLVAFNYVTEWLTPVFEPLPVPLSNLLISLASSCCGIAVSVGLHYLFTDKRLMFGTHLWLALYAVASLIAMAFLLRGTGSYGVFLVFFGWFVVIPVILGTLTGWLLMKRDYKPKQELSAKPDWKKYTERR